jgi:ribosome modulation factor
MPSWRRRYTPRDYAVVWYMRGLREGLSGYPYPKGPYPEGIPNNPHPSRRALSERIDRAFWLGHKRGLARRSEVSLPHKAIDDASSERDW